jgi:hypothetical protein
VNELAIVIGIVLFPGLITTVMCDKLTVHSPRWDSFKYSMYSFVFGVLCYALLQALVDLCVRALSFRIPPIFRHDVLLNVWQIAGGKSGAIGLSEVFWATLLSPVVAAFAAIVINFKVINAVARYIGISEKFGDENLYSYFLNAKEVDWLYVRDAVYKLAYRGRIIAFSETEGTHELTLSEVTVFDNDEGTELYSIPLTYIARPVGTLSIEAGDPIQPKGSPNDGQETPQRGNGAPPSEGRDDPPPRSDSTSQTAPSASAAEEEVGNRD